MEAFVSLWKLLEAFENLWKRVFKDMKGSDPEGGTRGKPLDSHLDRIYVNPPSILHHDYWRWILGLLASFPDYWVSSLQLGVIWVPCYSVWSLQSILDNRVL